jgi:hypothetical protein
MNTNTVPPAAGLTTREFCRRYRIGSGKVRALIAKGEIRAVNTAMTPLGKPRWVIPPEAVAEWELRRTSAPPARPPKRKKRTSTVDFYP